MCSRSGKALFHPVSLFLGKQKHKKNVLSALTDFIFSEIFLLTFFLFCMSSTTSVLGCFDGNLVCEKRERVHCSVRGQGVGVRVVER